MKSLRVVPIQNKFVFSVIRNKERKMIKKGESSTEYQPNQMGKTTSIIVLQSTKIILDWERYFSDLCRRSNPRMKKEESVFITLNQQPPTAFFKVIKINNSFFANHDIFSRPLKTICKE